MFYGFADNKNHFSGFAKSPFGRNFGFPQPLHDWNVLPRNVIFRENSESFVEAIKDSGYGHIDLVNTVEAQQGEYASDSFYGQGLANYHPQFYFANVVLPDSYTIAFLARPRAYTAGEAFAVGRYSFRFRNYGGGLEFRDSSSAYFNYKLGIKLADLGSYQIWRLHIIQITTDGIYNILADGSSELVASTPDSGLLSDFRFGSWNGDFSRGVLGRCMIFEGELTRQQHINIFKTLSQP